MKDRLTREEVLHVAHLARIEIDEKEIEKYQIELKQLLDSVEKINEIKNYDKELLFTPITHGARLTEDEVKNEISFDEIKQNTPHALGNFVEVPVMINE